MAILVFFLVFSPYFYILGVAWPFGYIFYLFSFILAFYKRAACIRGFSRDPLFLSIVAFTLICGSLTLINSMIRSAVDLKLLRLSVDPYLIYFSSRFVFYYYTRREVRSGLVKILTLFNVLNASVIYLSFASGDFRSALYSFLHVNPKIFDYPIPRFSGFLYDGFSYTSTLMSLITITCYVIFVRCKAGRSGLIVMLHVFTVPASLLAGRLGFIMLLIYFGLTYIWNFKKTISLLKTPQYIAQFFIFVLFSSILVYSVFHSSGMIGEYFRYSLRFVTSFFDNSGYVDYTTIELVENHLFLPNEVSSLFFGSGYLVDWPIGQTRPDPALTLGVFAFGLLGMSAYFFVLISPLAYILIKDISVSGSRKLDFPLVCTFMVLMFKDAYIFYPYPHFFLYFLCWLFVLKMNVTDRLPRM